jgi:hypothetical protein
MSTKKHPWRNQDTAPSSDSPNRVREVMKREDGGLDVTLQTGKSFTLGPDDEALQAWVVWTMLAP